ncbi:MAG: hypothetical protein HY204_01405 [Nitrospirae bacterium]|nr:hypothetical protein [Nitrospirota bacterium]
MISQERKVRTLLGAGILSAVMVYGLTSCMDAAAPNHSATPGNNFKTFVVDADYRIGAYPSLAIAPDGRLHASYYAKNDLIASGGGALRHAVMQSGVWTVETVDGNIYDPSVDVGRYTSIAVDGLGRVHLAYWDVTNGRLLYTTQMSGTGNPWSFEVVANPGGVCPGADLRLDALGNVYIGYCVTGSGVYYAKKDSTGTWAPTSVWLDPDVTQMSLQIDVNNNLHLAFFDAVEKKIKYMVGAGNGFSNPEDVTTSPLVGETRMELRLAGTVPHIVFYDIAGQTLEHTVKAGGAWTTPEMVSAVGDLTYVSDGVQSTGYLQLASLIDHLGQLRLSYFDGTHQDLKHAVLTANGWTYQTIDEAGDVGRTSAMAEDGNGTIHIIYRDTTNNALKYAYLQ